MGDPIRIDDVARRLVAMCPRRIEVVYTGLRAGEKMHEDLLGAEEADIRPVHPLISHVPVPPLDVRHVLETPRGIAAALIGLGKPPTAILAVAAATSE